MDDIRDNMRLYIKNNGYKQSAIAGIIGMNPVTFNQIMTKKSRLTADVLFKVCDALSVTPDELRNYNGAA